MSDGTAQFDRLLNPGFCGILSAFMAEGASSGRRGLPLVAVYLMMPMVLHRRTAERIERSSSRGLAEFVHRYPDVLVGLDRRAAMTIPNTRAGLAVAIRRGALQFDRRSEELVATDSIKMARARLGELLSPDDVRRVEACLKLGKWVGHMTVALMCDVLSVRPVWGSTDAGSERLATITETETDL
ncbi:hypothetical protein KEG38_20330 [Polyangium jinanense]|uniref:three component ABC system middle component n=1 Tax=Polyangium jinanense TaxID=2829994 RepID=UPI002341A4C6|nr:three component ABC system middle component [Polyangium jinanense]MDC3956220.1 hypothetical protein [Polyangium jinanense]